MPHTPYPTASHTLLPPSPTLPIAEQDYQPSQPDTLIVPCPSPKSNIIPPHLQRMIVKDVIAIMGKHKITMASLLKFLGEHQLRIKPKMSLKMKRKLRGLKLNVVEYDSASNFFPHSAYGAFLEVTKVYHMYRELAMAFMSRCQVLEKKLINHGIELPDMDPSSPWYHAFPQAVCSRCATPLSSVTELSELLEKI
ncbi:hypothetical protein QCA50_018321 [Cerrena zonata]|uniref:Uncharacterized protein n=1 Tax=Cerrena zonata TaxID=2478898 RepID=A0AAW0FIF2_9APHY